jgi:hypothetical protein
MEFPLSQRYYNILGIEVLQKNGFEVEVWDFTPFLHPQSCQKQKSYETIDWEKYYIFQTLKEARSAILKLSNNCFIICMVSYQIKSFAIYRAISKIELPYCVIITTGLPLTNNKKSLFNSIRRLKKISPSKIIAALFSKIPYNNMGIKPADIALAGGAISTINNYPVSKKTNILWMHTFDYDIYLKECLNPVQIDEKMGVFLDEYLPFHPDYNFLGITPPSTAEEYYLSIRKFFELIESKYGVHIVIAAHPTSHYEDHLDYFGGRPIIKGKTAELVKKSGFAIAHMSTSINFAILFHKPVIFLTTNRLQQSHMEPYIEQMSSFIRKKPINLDINPMVIDWESEISINENAYRNYKHSYIKKMGSEELPFWQIFANSIKNYNE